jgi:hypothetical protein
MRRNPEEYFLAVPGPAALLSGPPLPSGVAAG